MLFCIQRRASLGDLQFKASRFTEKMREQQIEKEKEERRALQKKKVFVYSFCLRSQDNNVQV